MEAQHNAVRPKSQGEGEICCSASRDHLQVLVVEDYPDSAESLALLLRLWGHEVQVAVDGPGALVILQTHRPNVALVDIGLPGMDGCELIQRIRALGQSQNILCIAVTGFTDPESRRRIEDAGFGIQLVKPVDPDRLQALLGTLVHAQRT